MSQPNDSITKEHIAMASVPMQQWCEPYDLNTALKEGTIFPCLNLTFFKAPQGDSIIDPQRDTDNTNQLSREQAMNRLTAVSFAINDLTLYLDTHPTCENGLKLFYQLLDERMKLLAEYAGDFYPLTQTSMITGGCSKDMYGWSEGPAPWEGACV